MKRLITLFLLFILSISSITAKDIRGRVSDGNLTALQNVYVYLKSDPHFGVVTNKKGEFLISLKGTEYLPEDKIIISHIGYETKEYQIKELCDSTCTEIILVESFMLVDQVVVKGGELSRKEKKNRKISIIKQFKEQAAKDFMFEDRTYKIVSDFEVTRDTNKLFYNKLIGEYKEQIGVLADDRDSVSLTYTDINNYINNDLEQGIQKMSDRFIDNNKVSKKKKENKRILDSLFYTTVLTDSTLLKEVLNLQKSFWSFNRNINRRIQRLNDNPKNWEIIEVDNQTILRYKRKYGLLGIVKQRLVSDYVVNPYTYSLERVSEEIHAELNIPFGYRLPPDALMLLNIISANDQEMKKYRIRHLHMSARLNTIYQKIDTSKFMDEMGYDIDITLIDTKKRNIKGESRILVKVLSSTNTAQE